MQTYKATNGKNTYFNNFNSIEEAQIGFSNLGETFVVSIASASEQIPQRVITLEKRMQYGYELYLEYLRDNDLLAAASGQPMPASLAESIAVSMSSLKLLLESGSLIQVKEILLAKTPDAVLTQERIDKYVRMINNFLEL